jgi:predicted AAA+ superfamily ATPase
MALALQVGSEVSYNELAETVGSDNQTVQRYIDLLEKTFVIFELPAFSRNIRNEIKKGKKIYFYDNGIRNAILGNFTGLHQRNDTGALWENFLISERRKLIGYSNAHVRSYFWRTTAQQEIDYVEERKGALDTYEFKWNPRKAGRKLPTTFTTAYSPRSAETVTRENYQEFLEHI